MLYQLIVTLTGPVSKKTKSHTFTIITTTLTPIQNTSALWLMCVFLCFQSADERLIEPVCFEVSSTGFALSGFSFDRFLGIVASSRMNTVGVKLTTENKPLSAVDVTMVTSSGATPRISRETSE